MLFFFLFYSFWTPSSLKFTAVAKRELFACLFFRMPNAETRKRSFNVSLWGSPVSPHIMSSTEIYLKKKSNVFFLFVFAVVVVYAFEKVADCHGKQYFFPDDRRLEISTGR